MGRRGNAPRWIGAVCGLLACAAAAAGAAAPCEADEVQPFSSLDLRYSPGLEYANFAQVRGRIIFPNITYQSVTIFNLSEVSLGGGYQIIQQPNFILAITAAAAQNSLGTQRIEPGLALYWVMDRLSISASGGCSIFVNSSAAPVIGIDPVEAAYKLDDRWTVGASATSFVVGQPIGLSVLPFVRYDDGHGFLEVRLDNLGPGYSREIEGRWAVFF